MVVSANYYNEEAHIAECIQHWRQIDSGLEIIIADGGSNDRSWEILKGLIRQQFFNGYLIVQYWFRRKTKGAL